ncbi:16S rRNA (cytosine967-C5)-methyltransferase [Litoreibacter ponti]|uniref:16S rRNA (Cytosine967-C5)-methyltransferase n=1 Tax=Litoreibacter ponti TaxID=1510457 RepID=A0A2T6BJ07_9RHOB|nr:RsmB/NOP family class I SAM-dependent RNA methyltransferase [Litoreibacter ponti]PTX56053.1 16S rRNA (cytosine967-C5)-methyltransferase [Litoreibacter ponti]
MTPGARAAAAIEILDLHLGGQPLEKALTNWARRSRFAGSKDRAAIRDIVFDRIRSRASCALRGGGLTGRGLVLGGFDLEMAQQMFTGEGHAPSPLSAEETARIDAPSSLPPEVTANLPPWLLAHFEAAFGDDMMPVCAALTERAKVFVRVNLRKGDVEHAQSALAEDGIRAVAHPLCDSALELTENPRKLAGSRAYLDGLVELQDVASQAVCAGLPDAQTMLDYCAGGGGKVLAYGARHDARLFAHDGNPRRLKDLPERAARAGVAVERLDDVQCTRKAPFDLVLCDVPCSGSGAWRRQPEGKWRLTPEALEQLLALQREILDRAVSLVRPEGTLAYATCSVLRSENEDQIAQFLDHNPEWAQSCSRRYSPLEGGDGFYVAHLTRRGSAS